MDSQVKFAAKDAKLYTVGPKKLALTAATTGITALHQAVLAAKPEAAISLIESQKIDAEENIIRYSLFVRPGSGLHAGELAEKLAAPFHFEITLEDGKVLKNGGSGPADQAGFSVKASFKEIKEHLTTLVIETLAAAPAEL